MSDTTPPRLSVVRQTLHRLAFLLGCAWTAYLGLAFLSIRHRGRDAKMEAAILLAPAYLLVATRRRKGYAMRTFIGLTVVLLALDGTAVLWRWLAIRIEPIYYLIPPIIAICVAINVHVIGRRSKHATSICETCNYNLYGNVSGRCPECGTPIEDDFRA